VSRETPLVQIRSTAIPAMVATMSPQPTEAETKSESLSETSTHCDPRGTVAWTGRTRVVVFRLIRLGSRGMRMKSGVALITVAILLLAGCGGSDQAGSEPDRRADLTTAQLVVDAWKDAGLPLGEVRDNTAQNCAPDPEAFCTALISNDYASVRVFVDAADADKWVVWSDTHVVDRVNASFGGDSDFWPFDTAPYIEIMDEVLGSD
jgi:hypothetical protein